VELVQQLVNGLTLGSLYALIAVGYTVVYGIVQLINFAHGEVFMIGAFGALTTYIVLFKDTTAWWVLLVMILGGMVAAVATAVLMERVAYRPLRHAPRLAPLITAIGISIFLQEIVRLYYGRIPGLPDAKQNIPFPAVEGFTGSPFVVGGVTFQRPALFTMGALVLSAAFLWWFINTTRQGRAMQAVSQDPDTARLMGIDVDKVIVIAFAVGAALAAIAGVAQGLQNGNIEFRMGFMAGLKAFTAAVLGGIGNVAGAVVGGLTLGVVESIGIYLGAGPWKDVVAFALLILVLVFRPQGIMGARVVDRA
jgi:branched-chain amino acid transport system permease protein